MYYNGLEQAAYKYGHNDKLNDALQTVDDVIANLQDVMQTMSVPGDVTRQLSDVINVMVVSDHGYTSVAPTQVIDMTSRLSTLSIRHVISDRSILQIWPQHDAFEKVRVGLHKATQKKVFLKT